MYIFYRINIFLCKMRKIQGQMDGSVRNGEDTMENRNTESQCGEIVVNFYFFVLKKFFFSDFRYRYREIRTDL